MLDSNLFIFLSSWSDPIHGETWDAYKNCTFRIHAQISHINVKPDSSHLIECSHNFSIDRNIKKTNEIYLILYTSKNIQFTYDKGQYLLHDDPLDMGFLSDGDCQREIRICTITREWKF